MINSLTISDVDLSKYKKRPPKCGCEGCVFDVLQDCPVSAGPKPSEWPCIVDDCIYVEEDENGNNI